MNTVTWEVSIDRHECMASGMCAGVAPDLFELGEEYAQPVAPAIPEDERALDAADSCPATAITISDGGTVVGPRP